MTKLDPTKAPIKTGSIYPEPFNTMMEGRSSLRLGDLGGLTQFGANLVILEPGAKSSLRHWHEQEDEFIMITQGTCTLIDNNGETEMSTGACAAFPANTPNAHQFVNKSDQEARFLVIGTRGPSEVAHYPDNDMKVTVKDGGFTFTKPNGDPL